MMKKNNSATSSQPYWDLIKRNSNTISMGRMFLIYFLSVPFSFAGHREETSLYEILSVLGTNFPLLGQKTTIIEF